MPCNTPFRCRYQYVFMANNRSRKPSAQRRQTPQPSPIPGWVWIFGISALLAFAGFLYFLTTVPADKQAPPPVVTKPAEKAPAKVAAKPKAPVKEEKKQPEPARFEFYEMLPQTTVATPRVEEYQPSTEKEQFHYLLQVGSFRSAQDAERQRAMVAFQGMKGTIDQVTASDGSQWYRVHVGPFDSRSRMNKAVDKLVTINIQPLVKKIKPTAKP